MSPAIKFTYFTTFAVPLSLLITATGIPILIQYFAIRSRRKTPPLPGKKIILRIHYPEKTPLDSGKVPEGTVEAIQQFYYLHEVPDHPRKLTVIFEAGNTFNLSTFGHLQRTLAEHGIPSFAYDRLGYGYSTSASTIRLPSVIAHELKTLLKGVGISGPLLVVGHSFGGIYARVFAAQSGMDVRGILLADSIDSILFKLLPDQPKTQAWFVWTLNAMSWLVWTGFPRVLTRMPFFWRVVFMGEQQKAVSGKSFPSIVEEDEVSMSQKEFDLYRKDIGGVVESLLSQYTWSAASKEAKLALEAAEECDKSKLSVPIHIYAAGKFNQQKLGETWMKGQRKLYKNYNKGKTQGSYLEDLSTAHWNLPWAASLSKFLLNIYEQHEELLE